MAACSGSRRAFEIIRSMPRVALTNIRDNKGANREPLRRRGGAKGKKCGKGHKGQHQRGTLPRIGFEGGATPFYLLIPKYPYNEGHSRKREYQPISLEKIQHLIDVGRLDPSKPIDVTSLCNARAIDIDIYKKQYGIQLREEGADIFDAKVNIEVQWASEASIAAVERRGGVITTAFYDLLSVNALAYPLRFFQTGKPIPRRLLPPEDAVPYYTAAENRGYLADPEKISEERYKLAQKYGYVLPDISKNPLYEMLMERKDPRQIFFGLEPGWIVNLKDKVILKTVDEDVLQYYRS
ncbi:large ribosomal subunit protein uL15m-like [Saccoglossus kowalevskii]|uniref:Large ribosomal subunit protein uL15m n=1 Tax=Saccoglossus kowalevskii TaxID=10224 RepID=A0ABM0GUE8_SACKO|nr:PREDICTED: 39S ribosomal protein L15, mitochondrial-like [Saccoglossus kowalevskii]